MGYIFDTNTETLSLTLVEVVREFMDVVSTCILGISPDRDIDFGIDLEPGAKPIYFFL